MLASGSGGVSDAERWQLNVYELNRTPHELIKDNPVVTVEPSELQGLVTCPICLDVLEKTMTTTCLHRFCQQCITTALRSGNKECPNCREKLVSRRSLRPDKNYDAIIKTICGKKEEEGEEGEEGTNETEGRGGAPRRIKTRQYDRDHPQVSCTLKPAPVDIVCRPHPKLKHLEKNKEFIRYFQTSSNATVEHVAKYLYLKFQHQSLLPKLSKVCADGAEEKKGNAKRWKDRHNILKLYVMSPTLSQLTSDLLVDEVKKQCAGGSGEEERPIHMYFMVHHEPI